MGEKSRNCGCCCCLLLALIIGFLGLATAVLFGVVYHRIFLDGNFVVLRMQIAELEMQLSQSQDAVTALQAQVDNIPSAVSDKVLDVHAQLDQAVNEITQTSSQQAQEVAEEFTQTLYDIRNVLSTVPGTVDAYSASRMDEFSSASSQTRSVFSNSYTDYLEARRYQLANDSTTLIGTLRPLPIDVATQRTTYTRWGNSTCPDVNGTTLVYAGLAGGSPYFASGGGANIVCLPTNPETGDLLLDPESRDITRMYGSEYEAGFLGSQNENVPCAVCSVSGRSETIMIPAKVSCPATWTREYYGYLMSERSHRSTYTCIDVGMEFIPGYTGHVNGCDLWVVEPSCSSSLPCPPYDEEKELACVVCSR